MRLERERTIEPQSHRTTETETERHRPIDRQSVMECDLRVVIGNKTFPLKVAFGHGVYLSNDKTTKILSERRHLCALMGSISGTCMYFTLLSETACV